MLLFVPSSERGCRKIFFWLASLPLANDALKLIGSCAPPRRRRSESLQRLFQGHQRLRLAAKDVVDPYVAVFNPLELPVVGANGFSQGLLSFLCSLLSKEGHRLDQLRSGTHHACRFPFHDADRVFPSTVAVFRESLGEMVKGI